MDDLNFNIMIVDEEGSPSGNPGRVAEVTGTDGAPTGSRSAVISASGSADADNHANANADANATATLAGIPFRKNRCGVERRRARRERERASKESAPRSAGALSSLPTGRVEGYTEGKR